MKIYTSYFAMSNKIPKDLCQISICLNTPTWFNGKEYDKLAPKWEFFKPWKYETYGKEDLYHNNDYYISEYESLVTGDLYIEEVIRDLKRLSSGKDVVLMCYEKPGDFCHRFLAAKWIEEQLWLEYDKDVTVKELKFN